MRKICFLFIFLILAFFTADAQNIPQPAGWVNDFANVISSEYRDKLTVLIRELEEKTSAEIAVVTIYSIAPYDEKEYARLLFDNWKPGKKGKDNGVLILLAVKERRWRIETGYGVEGILPDGLCGEIGRNYMVPYFKQGNYAEGLYYAVTAITRIIASDANVSLTTLKGVSPKNNRSAHGTAVPYYYFAVFSLFFFLLWNIPWPIFIGLPFTLLFCPFLGIFPIVGYIGAMVVRYFVWRDILPDKRKSFLWILIFGLACLPKDSRYYSGGGGFGGGGGGGFGGGGGGGGGAGGGF